MSITNNFLNQAALSLEMSNAWIAYDHKTGFEIIKKDCYIVRTCLKSF